jgi:hypothetical protein
MTLGNLDYSAVSELVPGLGVACAEYQRYG